MSPGVTAFSAIQAALSAALATVKVLSIEHVGSTSVQGMAAKPVIDIDIVVAEEDITAAIAALELNGYIYHVETASLDRYSFRYNNHQRHAKGTEEQMTGEVRRNVYICGPGSLSLKNHLVVREALRNDRELREEHSRVKMELAKNDHATLSDYVDGKDAILRKVLSRGGLSKEEIDDVGKGKY
ncbi:hypothetical protein VC83_06430 [Pseudogymnoascus destructans]|uniref:GrpB domain protein n=2 Tax=Pseudogymnoascus destructans TaxID=655981 RepID=L8FZH4_PSED2|nr:uncharacterized protein VC83_06430 [Pseudogymnoascus destructans]ELR05883.1 hypothetical protein GMDG_07656 [Pseudogymnoascus destructans 20631-21]OAF58178.1 hypothetical protein VC83_06430 [Pseudogymnoascus destructans]